MCSKNTLKTILDKVTLLFQEMYQDNLCEVYLYGSYARGDFDSDSDIDIVAIVNGQRIYLQDKLKKIWNAVSDMELTYETIISPTVIPQEEFETYKQILPYYQNILKEGIKING